MARADFSFVDFRPGSAEKTDLSDSDLNHLDAQDASFRGAILGNADLSVVRFGDETVRLWEADSGRMVNTLAGHKNWSRSVAWSPDGQRLASGSSDQTVRLWDAASGRLLNTLTGHENWVNSVAWSPDGQRLALAFSRGLLEIWDIQSDSPRPLIRLYQAPNGSGFAATPDGYVSGPPEALEYVRFGDGWGALRPYRRAGASFPRKSRCRAEAGAAESSGAEATPEIGKNLPRHCWELFYLERVG